MASFEQFISSIRQEFGEQDAGKKFEVFCKWFLENDPEWSKKVDKVWLWDEYPNKWQRQDLGTDLVFKDNDGLIWAVQAKCYSEHRTTTKGDMNSFLADTGRPEVDRRLWLQTTNKIEAKAEKTYKGQDKHVTIVNLNNFRDAQIDYPSSFADLYQTKVKDKPKPDPHQVKAIEDVTVGLQKSDRGQMIMACGTGKTFTTLWIKEALKSETTLVLLPSLSLLSQTMREWAWAGNTDFEILNVCSDKSVGKKTEDMAPSDAPFAVTSDVHDISKFLQKSGPRVVFCTYQSSQLIAEAQIDTRVPTFDLAIADEAHRCAGKADAGFATILDGEKIRASKRLFTTATPRYFGKAIKDASKAADLAVIGMDDETVFGPVIHQLTFGQAIQDELLNDYQVVIVGVDEPMVKQWIDNYEIVATNPDETTDARTLAAKIGMLKAVKDYDLKRVISFHSRVSGAKKFSEELTEVADLIEPVNRPEGTFLSDYVSGAMKAGDRKDKIDKLKELEGYDRGILTNARCLAEGVDVPSLDGVAFIDPKGSQVEIIQAVGRAIRKVRGAKVQTKGTIVIPVFIEEGDDHEASIEASNFKPVWEILRALRAHDNDMASTLDQYRTNMAKNASQSRESISDKIIFDMPVSVDAEFSSALRTVLVEASTASWEFWFGLLEQFKEREGHCLVNQTHETNGYRLGAWVAQQRLCYSSLHPLRYQKLNQLGFVWNALDHRWEIGCTALKHFYFREGHSRVPKDYVDDSFTLGKWVRSLRGRKNGLSREKIDYLKAFDFIWHVYDEAWDEAYAVLKLFVEREGHSLVPQRHSEGGFSLGSWVGSQRNNKPKLSFEQIQALDELQFIWDVRNASWNTGFESLRHFFLREGHSNPRADHTEGDFKLGRWVSKQRSQKNTLSPEQLEKLQQLDFVWDAREAAWDTMLNHLREYQKENGNCLVPVLYEADGTKLGTWVRNRRKELTTMSPERKQMLDDIGFIWDASKDKT
ncbi:Helicase associated domain protein [Planktomarina temperata]|nr:Helicase associated domain protein [Planktomarina temperata]